MWNQSPRAYLGSTVPGFPNMFILLGPNSIGINSVVFSVEAQIAYVMEGLRVMERQGLRRVELRSEVLDEYVEECARRSEGSVWTAGGCTAYYLDENGRNYGLYPGFAADFRRRTRRFDVAAYRVEAGERVARAAA